MSKLYKFLLSLAAISLIIACIFFFSEQSGTQSHSLSRNVASWITQIWMDGFEMSETSPENKAFLEYSLDGPIRKLAHLFIYNILGFFGYYLLWRMGHKKNTFGKIFLILLLVLLVACADELNQYFSGGRGASVHDVIIDLFGGCIGIYMVFLIRDFRRHLSNGISDLKRSQ